MPIIQEEMNPLRCFGFHGIDLKPVGKGSQHLGECPFCGKEKLYAEPTEGKWDCKSCGKYGNPLALLRQLHETGTTEGLETLADERGILESDTLTAWGIIRSHVTGDWLVAGYNVDGEVHNLYRYVKYKTSKGEWKQRLMPTPGVHEDGTAHGLHGVPLFDPKKRTVYVCEGVWDGMVLWEIVGGEANVLAVPGDHVFRKVWALMLVGYDVVLLYDSDHPPTIAGRKGTPSGTAGMQKATKVLLSSDKPPKSVSYLAWGVVEDQPEGPGYHPDLPSGTDVRDVLRDYGDTKGKRVGGVTWLLGQVRTVPSSWEEEAKKVHEPQKTVNLKPTKCESWEELLRTWGKGTGNPMRWRQELSDVLATMMAIPVSTEQTGDQLFLQVVAEPGTGKSALADALVVSKHCFALEHLTGFHSGYRDSSGKDFSLLARINHKCLVTSEGDVLMNSPQFDEIMAEQRRIFDGVSSKSYKTMAEEQRYEGLRTPWIICGTPAMMVKSQAQLGDRFLRVCLDPPGAKEEDAILMSAARSAWQSVRVFANGSAESSLPPGIARARCMTAGYLDYLADGVSAKIGRVGADEDDLFSYCSTLGRFTADYRARPDVDTRKDSDAIKELPTRLTKQLIRLATCLAVVLGKTWVDGDVLRIVRKVAIDTARGRTLDIARYLYTVGETGCRAEALSAHVRDLGDEERVKRWLYFMRKVGVVIPFSQETMTGIRLKNVPPLWKLSPRARRLFKLVIEQQE